MRPNISQPETWGQALSAARFSTTAVLRYTFQHQNSPKPSCSHPFLQASLPDGNLDTRQGELPETPWNPVGALQAEVDAENELQRDKAAWTHVLSGNPDPAYSTEHFKIQPKKILHMWVTVTYFPPKLKERLLHFHSTHCHCLKWFLMPKALLELVSPGF